MNNRQRRVLYESILKGIRSAIKESVEDLELGVAGSHKFVFCCRQMTYHNQDMFTYFLRATNLDDAIAEAADLCKSNGRELCDKTVYIGMDVNDHFDYIAEDDWYGRGYDSYFNNRAFAPRNFKLVAEFAGHFETMQHGYGGWFRMDGIEDPDNWTIK